MPFPLAYPPCPLPCCWVLLPVLVMSPALLWWSLCLCPAKQRDGLESTWGDIPHCSTCWWAHASGAVLRGKQGLCLASVLFFLIRPNKLHYTSAKNVLLLCLPEFWSLCMGVRDPGQHLMGVPLLPSHNEGCSWYAGVWDGGWQVGCWGFFPSSCPWESLQLYCWVLQRAREREQEVAVT